ncbi:hypothetical protein P152DRAFT_456480 [Eremomyces bilateralis CBS 781.70]|uniref:C2H2-type domain-containing protein n=1 Tax=Eremomyces bilateralis CBS 781.70 TaxID=1392243 RepID=A0A6G1G8K3_9PEZI|nr:uncharacterized protein P152DRAFT_456480 [Eremomyces bilateralis CBS 781.70]KAF1814251.1 hypothetical protein P152DRAFT_456480 [Eremomyces bilateralis CBS 781.70]
MDSPGSPLSDHSDDEFAEDMKSDERSPSVELEHEPDQDVARPAKRQKTTGPSFEAGQNFEIDELEISEDSDGSVPGSPMHYGAGGSASAVAPDRDDDAIPLEQVTMCKWDGCPAGDLGNMDNLVRHIHNDHIQAKQKKYSCEWADCPRKGITHASAYALRAHMRSHTREKPFYCTLPECDRAFTRSDALAKHMRTVHETESLRPSDPIPKQPPTHPAKQVQRIRLFMKGSNGADRSTPASPAHLGAVDVADDNNNIVYGPPIPGGGLDYSIEFPKDIEFTPEEKALPPPELYRLLKKQLDWAKDIGEGLKEDVDQMLLQRKHEWAVNDALMDRAMEKDLDYCEHKLRRKGKLNDPKMREILNGMRRDMGEEPLVDSSRADSLRAQLELAERDEP